MNVFPTGQGWTKTLRKAQQISCNVFSHTSVQSFLNSLWPPCSPSKKQLLYLSTLFISQLNNLWINLSKTCTDVILSWILCTDSSFFFFFFLIFSISKYHGKEIKLEKAFVLTSWKIPDKPIMFLAHISEHSFRDGNLVFSSLGGILGRIPSSSASAQGAQHYDRLSSSGKH